MLRGNAPAEASLIVYHAATRAMLGRYGTTMELGMNLPTPATQESHPVSRFTTIFASTVTVLALGTVLAVHPFSAAPAAAHTVEATAGYSTQGSTWAELVIAVVAIITAAVISALAYARPKHR